MLLKNLSKTHPKGLEIFRISFETPKIWRLSPTAAGISAFPSVSWFIFSISSPQTLILEHQHRALGGLWEVLGFFGCFGTAIESHLHRATPWQLTLAFQYHPCRRHLHHRSRRTWPPPHWRGCLPPTQMPGGFLPTPVPAARCSNHTPLSTIDFSQAFSVAFLPVRLHLQTYAAATH